MPLVRVICEMVEDLDNYADPKSIIVLNVILNRANYIKTEIQSFGYNKCWTENRKTYKEYPFILKLDGLSSGWGRLDYGGFDEDADDQINLIHQPIRRNTEFTLCEHGDGKDARYTYVVTGMHVFEEEPPKHPG